MTFGEQALTQLNGIDLKTWIHLLECFTYFFFQSFRRYKHRNFMPLTNCFAWRKFSSPSCVSSRNINALSQRLHKLRYDEKGAAFMIYGPERGWHWTRDIPLGILPLFAI